MVSDRRPYRYGSYISLQSRRFPWYFSHLLSNAVFLGSSGESRRLLYQYSAIMACNWSCQPGRRYTNYFASTARLVEIEGGYDTKARPLRYIFARNFVSHQVLSENQLILCSILAVTGIRIKALMDYNLLDTSYGLGPAVFWSNLEPLLGLINCCLPVIQPAIGMIMGKQLWSKESKHGPNIPYKRNGSSNRKSNKHRPMGRLDPTSYFATSDTESQDALYESQMTHSTHVGLGEVNQENEIVLETSNAILVEQRWEVSWKSTYSFATHSYHYYSSLQLIGSVAHLQMRKPWSKKDIHRSWLSRATFNFSMDVSERTFGQWIRND